jgi:hypothetical protein
MEEGKHDYTHSPFRYRQEVVRILYFLLDDIVLIVQTQNRYMVTPG